MGRRVVARPPAKINLVLRVGALRDDGFHDVRTLLQSIGLSDTLTASERPGPFALSVRSPGVPDDGSNLVWRAAARLWQVLGREGDMRGVHVKLEKQIPVQAGLGGGSADAAAALAALNRIWDGHLSRRDLMRIGRELGSDVPFFLQGGTALGVGRGEELYPVEDVKRLGVIVVKPSVGVSTRDAYGWVDEDRAAGTLVPGVPPDAPEVDVGWPSGPIRLHNDFDGPVARRLAAVAEAIDGCRAAGVLAAGLTGSGSAVYALLPEARLRTVASRLRRPDWLVLATRTLTRREAARRMGL